MLLFALVLLVVGGVIAYMGDRLGTYIGKKRLSAWGLRPRHTAMLYTVLSGGLIAVLTLFALIGYDNTIQTALLRGPQLLEDNHRLSQQNRQQSLLIRSRETEARMADDRATAAQARARQAEADTRRAEARARQATRHAQNALQLALDAEGRLHHSLDRLTLTQTALQRSRNGLLRRQAQLGAAQRRLASVNGSLGSTRADLGTARLRLHTAQRAVQTADAAVRRAQTQYATALTTVIELTQQGERLSARNSDLTQQNTALDAKNQQLLTQTTFLQGAHLVYHRFEEVGRRVIPTDQPTDAIRRALTSFLDALGQTAERAGAGRGENGRAVRVVAGSGQAVTEDEALDSLAQSIAQQSGSIPGVVVIAAAHYNTFGGEPVLVDVQPYDNTLVFAKGTVIAVATVDGSLPENQILDVLSTFLKQRVQTEARRQGVIPRSDPNGETTVGEPTDPTKTLALVKQIQRLGPGAVVTARAAADTYSSGPLRLDLTAAPPPPTPQSPLPAPPRRGS